MTRQSKSKDSEHGQALALLEKVDDTLIHHGTPEYLRMISGLACLLGLQEAELFGAFANVRAECLIYSKDGKCWRMDISIFADLIKDRPILALRRKRESNGG